MLSVELTKEKDVSHLKLFLERINAPHTPLRGSLDEGKFRQRLAERLQEQKLQELQDNSDSGINLLKLGSAKIFSCKRCRCRKNAEKSSLERPDPNIEWKHAECKTLEDFKTLSDAATASNLTCIQCLKAISQSLSLWEELYPDWEGLSTVGCYMWIISYALQHLMDEDNPREPTLVKGLGELRISYVEIAQSGEIFVNMVEKFHEHSRRLRQDAASMVKKTVKNWKLDKNDPLQKRPEKPQHHPAKHTKRRIGSGMAEIQEEGDLLQETAFHLNWSPLAVMIKPNTGKGDARWTPLGTLSLAERLDWMKAFARRTLDSLEIEAESMNIVEAQFTAINWTNSATEVGAVSHESEVFAALLSFAKSYHPKNVSEDARIKMIKLVSEFWYSVDILHEESRKLLKLLHETRDIIRTCYVYVDVFYKWGLPSYDQFLIQGDERKKKVVANAHTMQEIRDAWGKFINQKEETRKLSDVSEMLVMMDFSTSAYQKILEVRPVEADGMLLKLEEHDMEENLPLGLVGSNIRHHNSQSRSFH